MSNPAKPLGSRVRFPSFPPAPEKTTLPQGQTAPQGPGDGGSEDSKQDQVPAQVEEQKSPPRRLPPHPERRDLGTVNLFDGFRCPQHPRRRRKRLSPAEGSSGGLSADCDCAVEINVEACGRKLLSNRGSPVWQALVNPLDRRHRILLPGPIPQEWLLEILSGVTVEQLRNFQAAHPHLDRSLFQPLWQAQYLRLSGAKSLSSPPHDDRSGGREIMKLEKRGDSREEKETQDRDEEGRRAEEEEEEGKDWEEEYEKLQKQKEDAWRRRTRKAVIASDRLEKKRKDLYTTKTLSVTEARRMEREKKRPRLSSGHSVGGSARKGTTPMSKIMQSLKARNRMLGRR